MSAFARFAPRLQQAIVSQLGWSSLRPVQEEAGAALLAGDTAIVLGRVSEVVMGVAIR